MPPPTATSDVDGDKPARRIPLTRERVLATALQLVDHEGLEALTRRRLGQELGRDAMALYRYAPDRAALLDGIVELVLDGLEIPPGGRDWQAQLSRTAHDFRRLGLAHPHVVSLIVTRPLATPLGLRPVGTLRPLERLLAVLTEAGFSPSLALRVYRLYMGFLYGHLLTELQELVADPEETNDLLRLGLHRLPVREFPLVRGLATDLANYDGAAELDQGLAVLFAGLQSRLEDATQSR
jgi:AcrR family transcriptional regulator